MKRLKEMPAFTGNPLTTGMITTIPGTIPSIIQIGQKIQLTVL
ncbi:MAG: hypothetical protein PHH93_04940 [Prolixibacteraceae bacterium]|nr:hypothetical protein [Prolixibacteraceae bacterium]